MFSGLSSALGAADKVFYLINRKAQLPPTGHLQPPSCEGRITLSEVTFRFSCCVRSLALTVGLHGRARQVPGQA
jgi:hypothetical protein